LRVDGGVLLTLSRPLKRTQPRKASVPTADRELLARHECSRRIVAAGIEALKAESAEEKPPSSGQSPWAASKPP